MAHTVRKGNKIRPRECTNSVDMDICALCVEKHSLLHTLKSVGLCSWICEKFLYTKNNPQICWIHLTAECVCASARVSCFAITCQTSQKCVLHLYVVTEGTYIDTYIHIYIHTYIHACMHTYIRTYIHTYTHTHTHAYIHTHTYTHIHTSIHTHIQGGSNMTGTDLYVNKPHCAAAVPT